MIVFSPWAVLLPLAGLVGLIVGVVHAMRAQTGRQRTVGLGMAVVGAVLLVLTYAGQHVNEATLMSR